jgi:hypothetical protein
MGANYGYQHQQQIRDVDGARQVRVTDLQIGDQVLASPALGLQNLLTVVAVEDNGALVFVTYQSRDKPVEYRGNPIVLVKA